MSLASRAARRHRRRDAGELSITAFMNLMVVLVPFLLITAVFSRLTIIELNLPSSSQAVPETPQAINLELHVRKGRIEVADRGSGLLRAFPDVDGARDLEGLGKFLAEEIKARFPSMMAATILLEPDISYDTVIQVMDTVRVTTVNQGNQVVQQDLFPEISIGDAPELESRP